MSTLNSLNPQQRKAVTTTHGPILLLAGAGSGKTRIIIQRIAYLIQKKKIPASKILAVTFTNKAAKEMQERLMQMLMGAQKGIQVSTFHSLCVKILRKCISHLGYRSNFTIYDAQDQLSVVKGIIDEHGYDESGLIDAKSVHWAIGQAKVRGKTANDFLIQKDALKEVLIGRVFEEYQNILKGSNALDFDDILNLTLTLMEEYTSERDSLSNQYRFIMVDEYQDTNRAQYLLLKYLCSTHRNLCVVGDDDQSIYGWRGADISNILDFEKDYPETQIIKLEQNYRSTQTILKAANHVIQNNENRMPKHLWSQKSEGNSIGWLVGENELEEMQKVVDQIRLQTLRSKRKYRDFAVLYRSNFQSRVIEEALREGGVPYNVVGGTNFYDRKEVKDAIAYLRVIYNFRDEVNLHRIVNFPRRGIGKISFIQANEYCQNLHLPLFKIMENASHYPKIRGDAARAMEVFTMMIAKYRQRFKTDQLDQVMEQLLEEVGFIRAIETEKADPKSKERKVACVFELISSLKQYVSKNPEKGLQDYLERVMLFSREENSTEDGSDQVTLLTLHSAKGLEFPCVYMIGMAEGLFPNKRALDEGGEAEERRLCYVGITRAQQELTFSMAKMRKQYSETLLLEPSRFLLEIDSDLFSIPIKEVADESKKEKNTKEARSEFFAQLRRRKSLSQA
ncbi:MAG: UvrD-helicase domain-containing protein [SAR324 cluster bacterium]|nr:UvrD-helicase domain-containing protein [SAR324 cluster bacterium]